MHYLAFYLPLTLFSYLTSSFLGLCFLCSVMGSGATAILLCRCCGQVWPTGARGVGDLVANGAALDDSGSWNWYSCMGNSEIAWPFSVQSFL